MDTGAARKLLEEYSASVAYIAVETPSGDQAIGTATHIGEGIFITARHVIEGNEILEMGSTEAKYVRLPDGSPARTQVVVGEDRFPAHLVHNRQIIISGEPIYHPDPRIDVAAVRSDSVDSLTPWVPLGGHLEDFLGTNDFTLTEAIIMGYPPVPFSLDVSLVASRAEVSGQVSLRDAPPVHFLLSAMARGGYSGAMVIGDNGYGLGVVSRSLLGRDGPEELGYMTAISVDPIYEMLAEKRILPLCQSEVFDGYWNTHWIELYSAPSCGLRGRELQASVGVFDDGQSAWLDVLARAELIDRAVETATAELSSWEVSEERESERKTRIRMCHYSGEAVDALRGAAESISMQLEADLKGSGLVADVQRARTY